MRGAWVWSLAAFLSFGRGADIQSSVVDMLSFYLLDMQMWRRMDSWIFESEVQSMLWTKDINLGIKSI